MMRICAVLACFILAGCATAANDGLPRMPDRDFQARNADGEHLICTHEPVIGTRLPQRRVCRTREEWAVINRQATEEVDRVQRAPLPNTAQDGN
jgi:hypothetical protein